MVSQSPKIPFESWSDNYRLLEHREGEHRIALVYDVSNPASVEATRMYLKECALNASVDKARKNSEKCTRGESEVTEIRISSFNAGMLAKQIDEEVESYHLMNQGDLAEATNQETQYPARMPAEGVPLEEVNFKPKKDVPTAYSHRFRSGNGPNDGLADVA